MDNILGMENYLAFCTHFGLKSYQATVLWFYFQIGADKDDYTKLP